MADERAGGDRTAIAAGSVRSGVEAPGVMAGVGVPQIALGAGQAGVAFGTVAEIGQRLCLETDPCHRRPQESAAPAAPRQLFVAEPAAHELDPAGERFVVDPLRLAQIAQFQPVAVVHVHRIVAAAFHQHAAGAGIADIQHQIHVHRPIEPGGRFAVHEGEAQPWRPHRSLQQGQHGEPGGRRVRAGAQLGFVHPARGAAPSFVGVKPLMQPFAHPFLFQKPAGVGLGVAQGEFLAGLHVQRAGGEIGPAFAGRQQLGVECQGDAMGIAVGVGSRQFQQPRSCPVDRSLVEQMVTVRVGLADARERQRQPDAVEQRGGLGGVEGKDLFRLGGPAVLGHELAAGIVGIQRG